MLGSIRVIAKTWYARALFGLLVVALGLWGIAGSIRSLGSDTAVAHVGGSRIEPADLQRALQADIARLRRQNGPGFQLSATLRDQLANQAATELVYQRLVDLELKHLGVAVPDSAVRQQIFGMSAFKDANGHFDRQHFLQLLQTNGLDETTFVGLVRQDVGRQQLVGALSAGVGAPETLVDRIFAYARETRVAQVVRFPLSAVAAPPTPTAAELQRFWRNNPDKYRTPEYRTVKLIVLSPETLASQATVSAEDIKKYYDLASDQYNVPELRTLEIIAAPSEATATSLATVWASGADWKTVQAAARKAGASAIDLPRARAREVPDKALAASAFAAPANTVSQPVKGEFNWYVFRVAAIVPAIHKTLAEATPEIRRKIAVLKAADMMDDHVTKLEDAMASGNGLAALPADLGVAAVEGTLDPQGNTRTGEPAPIPAWPALRQAILAQAFQAKPGAPADLRQLPVDKAHPSGAWYAVQVQKVDPPAQKPFASVATEVSQDWTDAQQRHEAETAAAALLAKVRGGMTLAAAAKAAGLDVATLAPTPRPIGQDTQIPQDVPQSLVAPLFAMKQGDVTMVGTPDGYLVAQLSVINDPKPASDPIGAGQMRLQLSQSIGGDVVDSTVFALRARYKVTLNAALIHQIAQP